MDEFTTYEPPLSVWKLIEECVSIEKLPLVRSCLGESKIDYCNDMRQEVVSLLEIWDELMGNTQPIVVQKKSSLPEPPQQRELLVREIQLLLENLKEKENGDGRIPLDCNRNVLNYALGTGTSSSTDSSRPSTPMRRSGSRNSGPHLCNQALAETAKSLPILDIERPIGILKDALQIECDTLTENIEMIRQCVEEGHCFTPQDSEPSINELRGERKKLENALLKDVKISQQKSEPRIRSSLSKGVKTFNHPLGSPNELPPVRPPTAPHDNDPLAQADLKIEFNHPIESTSHSSFFNKSKKGFDILPSNEIKIPLTPVLGRKSNTFPNDLKNNEERISLRNNSTPMFSSQSSLKMNSKTLRKGHDLDREGHDLQVGRVYEGAFCGTPDSGVSSRPTSQMGVPDSLYMGQDMLPEQYSSQTENFQLGSTSYPSDPQLNKLGSKRGVGNKTQTPLAEQLPKPPSQAKPRGLSHTTIRRLRIDPQRCVKKVENP